MRLIDADALTKALADLWYDGKITITGVSVADLIAKAPTIKYRCEFCGKTVLGNDKYCAYCGTKVE